MTKAIFITSVGAWHFLSAYETKNQTTDLVDLSVVPAVVRGEIQGYYALIDGFPATEDFVEMNNVF